MHTPKSLHAANMRVCFMSDCTGNTDTHILFDASSRVLYTFIYTAPTGQPPDTHIHLLTETPFSTHTHTHTRTHTRTHRHAHLSLKHTHTHAHTDLNACTHC